MLVLRHASRNAACGVLAPSVPGDRLALLVCKKGWGVRVPPRAHLLGFSPPGQEAWRTQEVGVRVAPHAHRRGLIPGAQEERLLSPAAWGPARARRESSCPAAWAEKGGASRHSCRGRTGRHALARDSGAPAPAQEWGCLRRVGRKGSFAPRVPGWGEGDSRRAGTRVSRHAPSAGCGGTRRGWRGPPRAKEGRARAYQRWQEAFRAARVCGPCANMKVGLAPRTEERGHAPLSPGEAWRARGLGSLPAPGQGAGHARAAASCPEGGRGGERRAWDLPPLWGVGSCGLRLQLVATWRGAGPSGSSFQSTQVADYIHH